jgi:hypothetical protein
MRGEGSRQGGDSADGVQAEEVEPAPRLERDGQFVDWQRRKIVSHRLGVLEHVDPARRRMTGGNEGRELAGADAERRQKPGCPPYPFADRFIQRLRGWIDALKPGKAEVDGPWCSCFEEGADHVEGGDHRLRGIGVAEGPGGEDLDVQRAGEGLALEHAGLDAECCCFWRDGVDPVLAVASAHEE